MKKIFNNLVGKVNPPKDIPIPKLQPAFLRVALLNLKQSLKIIDLKKIAA